jgi:hypothetical protein
MAAGCHESQVDVAGRLWYGRLRMAAQALQQRSAMVVVGEDTAD